MRCICTALILSASVLCDALFSDTTNELWTGQSRPSWTGTAQFTFHGTKIMSVSAVIFPMRTTNRPATPDPYNGMNTHGPNHCMLQNGHIIGLSLGGPNVRSNIVPQLSGWQQTGPWAQMERMIFDEMKDYYGVVYVPELSWNGVADGIRRLKGSHGPTGRNLYLMTVEMGYYVATPKIPYVFQVKYGQINAAGQRIVGTWKKAAIQMPFPQAIRPLNVLPVVC